MAKYKNIKWKFVPYTSAWYGLLVYQGRKQIADHRFNTMEDRQNWIDNAIEEAKRITNN